MAPSGALALPRDIQPIRAIFADCCALAASGKPTSKQPSRPNSRRLMMVVLFYGQRGPNRAVAGRYPLSSHSMTFVTRRAAEFENRRHQQVRGGLEHLLY
jgi:hypothetical protein